MSHTFRPLKFIQPKAIWPDRAFQAHRAHLAPLCYPPRCCNITILPPISARCASKSIHLFNPPTKSVSHLQIKSTGTADLSPRICPIHIIRPRHRRQDRELFRVLNPIRSNDQKDTLEWCRLLIDQIRTDNNKIYSLHKTLHPQHAKGKAHKTYKFQTSLVFCSIRNHPSFLALIFTGNPDDSNTIQSLLN